LELEVMQILYRRATWTVDTFYTSNHNAKRLQDIPLEWRCCIDGITKKFYGSQANEEVAEYTLPNRDTALRMLYAMAKGFNVDGNDPGLAPGEVRTKLMAYWQGKDLSGAVVTAQALMTKTTKAVPVKTNRLANPGMAPVKAQEANARRKAEKAAALAAQQ
jgi:hypothetical protein